MHAAKVEGEMNYGTMNFSSRHWNWREWPSLCSGHFTVRKLTSVSHWKGGLIALHIMFIHYHHGGCEILGGGRNISAVQYSLLTVTQTQEVTTRVEAKSNTSTFTLRVVEGDEKRSFKSETVKYGWTRTQERLRWQGPAAYTKDRPVLSLERAPHKNMTVIVKDQ
jgi:hypothetical protein